MKTQNVKEKLCPRQIIKQNVTEKLSPSQMVAFMLTSSQMIRPNVQAYAINQPDDNINTGCERY
jgi:hypothetical protein